MAQSEIHWLRMGLLRLTLGLGGVAVGLALAGIYVIVWHLAALLAMYMFHWERFRWAYGWDLIFLAALLYGGYRYKARMPPPITDFENMFAGRRGGRPLLTRQGVWGISEMLFVAPRFIFWGVRHLQRIAWPSGHMAQTAERIHNALRSTERGITYDEILGMGETREEAMRALALLAKVELAQPWHFNGVFLVQASEPEWV